MRLLRPGSVVRDLAGLSERLRFAYVQLAGRALSVLEDERLVGTAGQPAFYSSATRTWSNYGSGRAPVGFNRSPQGFVRLRGSAHSSAASSTASDSTVFILSVDHRPEYAVFAVTACRWWKYVAISDSYVLIHGSINVRIFPSGVVEADARNIMGDRPTNDAQIEWVAFDGIIFHAPRPAT